MKLTPKEQDRLTIFTLAELARRRRARGIKLNYPEAVALICDEVMEEARAGRSYDEVIAHGKQVLTEADVMEEITSGKLPAKKIGSSYRVTRAALDAFLAQ